MTPLTPREKKFAEFLAEGFSMREATATLKIKIRTAYRMRETVLQKLGFQNQAEVLAIALRAKLARPDEV